MRISKRTGKIIRSQKEKTSDKIKEKAINVSRKDVANDDKNKKYRLVAKNVGDVGDEELKALFGKRCEFKRHYVNGKFKGTVFVQYENSEELRRALENQAILGEKKITLKYCLPKDKYLEKRKLEKNENVKEEKKAPKDTKEQKYDDISVYNLSYKETEENIRKIFSKYGNITKVNMKQNVDGFFTGIAVITMKVHNEILFYKKIIVNDRLVEVSREQEKQTGCETTDRIFLSNINKKLTKHEIKSHLNEYKIRSINLKTDVKSKRNLGFCFVQFKTDTDAKKFMQSSREFLGEGHKAEYAYDKFKKKK